MKKQIRIVKMVFWLVFPVLLFAGMGVATEGPNVQPEQKIFSGANGISAPYCGVSCLYAILKFQGIDVSYRDLLKGEYIGSRQGSSMAELKKAAEDTGLIAYPMGNLTLHDLRQLRYPTILHVKRSPSDRRYNHYVLFLGVEKDRVKLFNPPDVGYAEIDDLLTRWNGSGLLLSSRPINRMSVFSKATKRFVLTAALILLLVLFFRFARRRLPVGLFSSRKKRLGLSVGQGAVLGAAALIFAFAYHFMADTGLLARARATEAIQETHIGDFIPRVSAKTIHRMLGANCAVFIDARYGEDFEVGHLEGAINVPVNATDKERRAVLTNMTKTATVVVYCQSAGCKYAEKVAVQLMNDGFSDVSIFTGGWHEWSSKNRQEKEPHL